MRVNISAWAGQQVKLKLAESTYGVGFDDAGIQRLDIPGWSITADTRLETGGPTGKYVSTNGTVTCAAFTLAAGAQQIGLSYKGEGAAPSFYVELLRGVDFSQTVDLLGNVSADTTQWKTLKIGVQAYAGETVKLRLRRYFHRVLFDSAGAAELAVPGWTLTGTGGVVTGEDANGSFVSAAQGSAALRSSTISTGIIDRPGAPDWKFYAITYDIGAVTNDAVKVTWTNAATGANWVVLNKIVSSPTGLRTEHFSVSDAMGPTGYFVVAVGKGKVYSLADNIARRQLAEPFAQKVGLQIDTSTGAFGYQAQDVAAAAGGPLPLGLTRYYVGHADRLGTLGYRWSHSYDTRLVVTDDGDAGVVFGDGREAFFDWTGTAFRAVDARVHDTLVKNADGSFAVTTTTNLTYQFAADGKLTRIQDANGNSQALAYDGAGRLATVTDPGGRTLSFAYNASSRLASVTDPTGVVVTYAYDTAGDLASVTDPLTKTETYSYSQHRLTSVVDKAGQTLVTNTLDTTHRVTQQTDTAGKSITLAYDTPAKGATRVTDPTGGAATYYFDAFQRTTDKTDPTGRTISYVYDGSGNLQKIIDPAAGQWQFAYDANGNPTSSTDPLNQALQVAYNPQHLPTTLTDGRGNATALTYDSKGNLTSRRDPLSNTTIYTYDARGNRLTETTPLGQTTTYTYDAANNRTSTTDPLGHTWTYTHDAAGRVLTETNPLAQTTTSIYDPAGRLIARRDGLNQQTTYLYDAVGHLLMVEDPLGNRTLYTYDGRGLNTTKTDPAGKVWSYTYDDARRITAVTDPLGHITQYGYDAAGRLTTVTDPLGHITTYAYDSTGRLASEKDPLNRTTAYQYDTAGRLTRLTAPNGGVSTYTYDADGNRLTAIDSLNRTTTYGYDKLSRLTTVTDAATNSTTHAYDAAGRLTSVTNALNQTTSFTYDAAGRRTGVTNPLGQTTTSAYDNANRLTGVTDPLGRTTTYGYDAAGRRTTVTDPASTTTTTTYDAGGRVTRVTRPSGAFTASTYDPRGLLLTSTNNLNHTTTYAYDSVGQQVSMTDPRGAVTTYAYDTAGRQTAMTDALTGVMQYSYDAAGQQTAVTNARGKTTTSTYDALGNVLTQTDPLGRTTTWAYDLAGRLTGSTDPRGVSVLYGYDVLDRLTTLTYPGGSTSYAYDALGRRTSMTDPTGTTTWSYDAAGQATSIAAPQGTVGYAYNAAGQRTGMTLPGSRTVAYGYDTAGRLTTLTDWQSRQITFGYNADGQRATTTRPNGVTTTTYDAAGRLTGVAHTGPGGATLTSYSYTLDAAGNRTGVSGTGGTETYTLDALGRITAVTYPNGDTSAYTYDATGNRTSWTRTGTNPGTTAYTYDDADQLITEGTTTYTYDAAGNRTAKGGDSYTWDWANQLTSATVGGTATTYTYDGDGVRVRKTGTTTTTYLWDRESGLPLLVDDGTAGYVHAEGVQEQIDAAGTGRYPLSDALGSVRGLTDGAGALTASADYDVFGAVRASSGTPGAFGSSGEQADAETGLIFLRARSLDPASGRFLSGDSVQPNAPGTQGHNPYAYVANNPTTRVDPSGHVVAGAAALVDGRALLTQACTLTGWCQGQLAVLLAQAARAAGPVALTGVRLSITFLLVACALDVTVGVTTGAGLADRAGLGIGGLSCFWVFRQLMGTARELGSAGPWAPTGDDLVATTRPRAPRVDPRQIPLPYFPPLAQVLQQTAAPDPQDCTVLGRWRLDAGSMSPRSRLYELQVSGNMFWDYEVGTTKFDGCFGDVLLEAKGCGNARLWRRGLGIEKLRTQLRSQGSAGRAAGAAAIVWFVAEADGAVIVQAQVRDLGYEGYIHVAYLPAIPPC